MQDQDRRPIFSGALEHEQPFEDILSFGPGSGRNGETYAPVRKDSKLDKATYLLETREMKLQRYRDKKIRRVWDHKISYKCRKDVADNRQRVNGRFVKKSPLLSSAHKNSITREAEAEAREIPFESQVFDHYFPSGLRH